ncbi:MULTISPECIES: SDR family oxidoreductase [unclassified Halomonas]|uniref:SDR family NAD(P)-dependent oxidoreductase n=1 Tax=unclassified Halomonas TaxID=2609666 RepID=UPI0028887A34|nr:MULTISPECIES: SDR family oxidoreductase [unclassified Halomonas]MDT0500756.1 SDR family oxidoreductase [Halomonas sp. PAR7]MDT0513054.1 SDR family oxidoreductase [Halomonas sp. LES1]MDT0591535.1 SDR family oxidoreductase [Halomonas sp. PAR8]
MLTYRVALLGAAGGIGSAIADHLLAAGHRVWLLDLPDRRAALEELTTRWPGQARYLGCDLCDPDTLTTAFATIAEQAGGLDACINAAGVIHRAGFTDTSRDELERVMAINVSGPFQALQHAVALMQNGGRIVNVASAHGLRTGSERSAYAMSKGAILALTRALAVELGPRGILVNALAPGPVSAGMQDASSESRSRWQAATPLGRVALADEVARAVAFLVSAENTFISGDTLIIDGGATAAI